jgi:hypothetical protein
MLLAAVTAVLDRTDRVALLERTRAEIHGLTITELCDAKGWQRGGFYRRTDTAAERVAAYLNVRATVAKREPMPEYGCSATRK